MNRLVEIRAYKLKAGAAASFHDLMLTASLPMLRRWGTQVVCCGPSARESDSYFLIRTYADLEDRNARQDAFYGSAEWRNGPREALLALIENFLDTELWLSTESIEDLRRLNPIPKN